MTDNLKRVVDVAENGNGENISYDKQLIIDWLDDKVEVLTKCVELCENSPRTLCMGDFNEKEGEYSTVIDTCAWITTVEKRVHIYEGIKLLADAVGAELSTRPYCENSNDCHSFVYKGIEFFELSDPHAEPR